MGTFVLIGEFPEGSPFWIFHPLSDLRGRQPSSNLMLIRRSGSKDLNDRAQDRKWASRKAE